LAQLDIHRLYEKAPGLDAGGSDGRFDDDSYLENQLAILGSDSMLRRVVLKEQLADPAPNADAKEASVLPVSSSILSTKIARRNMVVGITTEGPTKNTMPNDQ
jgi:uncharacterized protein involved in exopolysaccharide biosynthesis